MLPVFFKTFRSMTRQSVLSDIAAGVVVGIIAMPLAIAFAIASGVSPEKGLYTAIIAGFMVSIFGGSKVQIGGPTGAFIVIVVGIIQAYGYDGLLMAMIVAGIMLIIMGVLKLGVIIQFIPYTVVVGFTTGIALIIAASQLNDFFGFGIVEVPSGFIEKFILYAQSLADINYYALAISIGSVILILLWQKFITKIPGALIAVLLSTFLVTIFNWPVETIGSKFGAIPTGLPKPHFPLLSFESFRGVIAPAFTIAILAGIESLLSAVVADGMLGTKHDSNMELVGQGFANIGAAIFGGIPATGAIARTAANIKNGGRTPLAGIVHALVLLLILLFLGKYAALIPLSALAGILMIVAYNMSEWRSFRALLKSPKSDVIVLIITFLLTVVIDLVVAIQVGMILALLLFTRRMHQISSVRVIRGSFQEEDHELYNPIMPSEIELPLGVEIYEINGPFFFGAADKFKNEVLHLSKPPQVRILRMRNVPTIDSSGLRLLEQIYKDAKKNGTALILSGVRPQIKKAMSRMGLIDLIGEDNICMNIRDAIERTREILHIEAIPIGELLARGGVHEIQTSHHANEAIVQAVKQLANIDEEEKAKLASLLLQREELASTGIGQGIAVPHPAVLSTNAEEGEFVALFYPEELVDFASYDDEMVYAFFIIVASRTDSSLHILSQISKACKDEKFISLLKKKSELQKLQKFLNEM